MNARHYRRSRAHRPEGSLLMLLLSLALSVPHPAWAQSLSMFETPFLPFDVGAATIGVATGDWNHDGWPDVAATNGWFGGVAVFLGGGDGTFGMREDYPTGPLPYDVVAADVDGDGEEDLVVADAAAPGKISVLRGSAVGAFDLPYHIGVGSSFTSVAVADLDDDGHPDVVAANATALSISVFMGSGSDFNHLTDAPAGLNPRWVALADCDGDGAIDAVVANTDYYNGAVTFLRGNHDGSFSHGGSFAVGSAPSSVTLADLDGDGFLDIATSNSGIASVSLSVLFGDGTGQFGGRMDYVMPSAPRMIVARDVNLDGHPDLLATCAGGVLSLLPGNGDGTFGSRKDHPVGPHPTSIGVADANGDGRMDLLIASHNPGSIGALLGNGDGSFGRGHHLSTPGEGRAVRVADLDEDGHPDLLVVNQLDAHGGYGGTFTVYLGSGDGSFGAGTDYAAGFGPSDLEVADLNGDGHADVVVPSPAGSPAVTIRLGDGTGSLGPASSYDAGLGPFDVAVGDLNRDSHPDLVLTQLWANSSSLSLLFGVGDGSFVRGPDLDAVSPAGHVALGDVTGDDKPDVVVANSYAGMVSVFVGVGDGTFLVRDDYPVGVSSVAGPDYVLVRDLNGDRLQDIVAANGYPGLTTVTVLTNNGQGGFEPKVEYDVASGAAALVAEDFDSDGLLDIASANWGSNSVSVLLGTGVGTFGGRRDFGAGGSPNSLATGDFDGDGRIDLAVRGSGVWILRNTTLGGVIAISIALQDVEADPGSVRLRWTVPDARESVSTVFRKTEGSEWTELGLATPESASLVVYEDHAVSPGETYVYRVFVQTVRDQDYSSEVWVVVPSGRAVPLSLRLDPVFPNPFQGAANLNFAVPKAGHSRLAIYDVSGRHVATMLDEDLPAGWRVVSWNGRDATGKPVASGTYFARLESAGEDQIRKLVVAR